MLANKNLLVKKELSYHELIVVSQSVLCLAKKNVYGEKNKHISIEY